MPGVSLSKSVAANSTEANWLVGTQYQTAARDWWVDCYMTGDVTGLELTATVGGEEVGKDMIVKIGADVPDVPTDLLIRRFPFPKGSQCIIDVANTTGAAVIGNLLLDLQPGNFQGGPPISI